MAYPGSFLRSIITESPIRVPRMELRNIMISTPHIPKKAPSIATSFTSPIPIPSFFLKFLYTVAINKKVPPPSSTPPIELKMAILAVAGRKSARPE